MAGRMEDPFSRSHRRDVHEQVGQPVTADYNEHVYDPKSAANAAPTMDEMIANNSIDGFKGAMEPGGVEHGYDGVVIPEWRQQLTLRAFLVSAVLGSLFCIVVHRLMLTVGVVPSLNIAAGLLGFIAISSYVKIAEKLGFKVRPFTRQENTVIQTCVVSCYGLAFSGGYGSYILGMSTNTYKKMGDVAGNTLGNVKDPQLSWLYPFILVTCFLGIFVLIPLRKIMIIDYKLTYPSGTATAVLINSFHTPTGAEIARKQVKYLSKYFTVSILWSFFKWFFSGTVDACGFDTFPSLGIKSYINTFQFDFSLTYVGTGMICPHAVNCSILFGAVISWGLMWPLIQNMQGKWYDASYEGSNFRGLFGYKVFLSIALILGDGLYHFVRVTIISLHGMFINYHTRHLLPTKDDGDGKDDALRNYDEQRRNEMFLKGGIPYWVAGTGYVVFAIIAIIAIPFIIPAVKWYFVVVAYVVGPVFAFSNAYGCGLTDWSLASNYGKILLFVFASWAGQHDGILAGLAGCGVAMTIVATGADLMQDFKTGYLTLSSPRSMFAAQFIGALMGAIIAPSTFWLFYKAFDVDPAPIITYSPSAAPGAAPTSSLTAPTSPYAAPYALIYRTMALVGVEGFQVLPKHCLQLAAAWFAFAIVANLVRDSIPKKYAIFIPIPMAMAIPFYLGAYFAIDMFVGTAIRAIWEYRNKKKADTFSAAIASGLICGDGLWTVPYAILNFAKINPPICMTFFPTKLADTLGYPLYIRK